MPDSGSSFTVLVLHKPSSLALPPSNMQVRNGDLGCALQARGHIGGEIDATTLAPKEARRGTLEALWKHSAAPWKHSGSTRKPSVVASISPPMRERCRPRRQT